MGANLDLLLEQILNSGLVQDALGRLGGGQPGITDGARGPPVSAIGIARRRVHKLMRDDGPFERRHDITQSHLAWVTGKLVATARTADAADDADAAQAAQELVEVGLGDLLAGGDFGALHGPLPETAGKLNDGVGAIIAAHRQSHDVLHWDKAK
jgi:hypothetical protein